LQKSNKLQIRKNIIAGKQRLNNKDMDQEKKYTEQDLKIATLEGKRDGLYILFGKVDYETDILIDKYVEKIEESLEKAYSQKVK
jgi:hypothetical protein